MRALLVSLCAASLLAAAPPVIGAAKKKEQPKASVVGLGRRCQKRSDCKHRAQICLKGSDATGKPLGGGFCALPCTSIEAGTTKTHPGFPAVDAETTKKILQVKAPPRCPPHYQCRSAGAGVPIDLCVKG